MKLICVDDEELVLRLTMAQCGELLPRGTEIKGFTGSAQALEWVAANHADLALLDIDMPGMNGLILAARIKELSPSTAIIFLTGYAQYAVEAFSMHASGYLLKPVNKERLAEEFSYAMTERMGAAWQTAHIYARTFGNFDLMVDGRTIYFSRSKSKELLAYLVHLQGSSVTRAEAAAILWEDAFYDRPMQKQLDVVIRSLRSTLDENGIGELLEIQRGFLRIKPELIECDLYRFFAGDIDAVNAYAGEYMTSYYWGELTAAYMDRKLDQGR